MTICWLLGFCSLFLALIAPASGGDDPMEAAAAVKATIRELDPSAWGSDPFRLNKPALGKEPEEKAAPVKEKVAAPAIRLTGVMAVNGSFLALVNGKQVKVGDKVAGVLVRRISLREIEVEEPAGDRRVIVVQEESERAMVSTSDPVSGAGMKDGRPAANALPVK